ncbi:uncharacterized protein LOC5504514 isoform X3 [Nematostella vectensis]|uniref:uncharacterized protein LOC116604486 isoform X3 n=2 Tax=Nematostella vectensis TaxID=45351 RepID=UPI00207751FF|nr:uncharacterized protein LOC116604486 isoform X3 [Nematostella vectensis]XP_048581269.1 uncharacterized protein LOC5504514 isoform X3 [Nematostella vectensis]
MRKAKCTSLRTIFLSEKDLNFNCVPRGSRLKQAEREGRVQTLDLATNHSSEDVLSILKSKFPTLRNELELPKRLQFLQPGAQGNNGWNVAFYGVPTGQEIYNAFNRTKRMYFCLRTKDLSSSTTPTPGATKKSSPRSSKKGKMIFKDIANGKAAFPATSDEGDDSDEYNQPLSTPIKKTDSSKVLSINPPGKGKKPEKPSKVHLRGSPSSSPSSGDDLVPVLEYKEVKEKSELNALSNPGKGKSTDPSKVHDRDPSPSSSDEYNQSLSTPIKKTASSKGEFLKEINLHSSFGVVVGTVREDEYEFGFLNQSITKGQMWYHTQALGDLCVVLENYHQACIQAKYSGRSLLICSGVEPDEPANYMLASFFRDVEDLEVKPLLCVCFEGTDDERAVSRNHGHGREPILLVLRAIGSNLGVVARAEDVNLSTFDGRVILKALSIKEKKEKKKKRRNKDNKKTVDHKTGYDPDMDSKSDTGEEHEVHFKSELLQTFIGGNDTTIDLRAEERTSSTHSIASEGRPQSRDNTS